MSYILDALNRSQQKRELKEVPTLATAPTLVTGEVEEKSRVLLGWGLVLITLFVVALLWLTTKAGIFSSAGEQSASHAIDMVQQIPAPVAQVEKADPNLPKVKSADVVGVGEEARLTQAPAVPPWQLENQPSPAQSDAKPEEPKPELLTAKKAAEQQIVAVVPTETESAFRREMMGLKKQFEKQSEKSVEQANVPLREETAVAVEEKESIAAPSPPEQVKAAPEPVTTQASEPPARPVRERQLPVTVSSRLPKRKVTLHAYSEVPQERFIILNSQRMEEGEKTNQGLLVKEIFPDGVIFEFEGYSFFKPL